MYSKIRIQLTTCRQVIPKFYTTIFPGDWSANKTIILSMKHIHVSFNSLVSINKKDANIGLSVSFKEGSLIDK